MEKQKQKYQCVVKLANFLIEKDMSWETTYPGIDQGKPTLHKYGGSSTVEKRVAEGTPMRVFLVQRKWQQKIPMQQ